MPEGTVAFSKGAPEIILDDCTQLLTPDGVKPLDAAGRARLVETAQEMAGQALRVLAVAAKDEKVIGQAEREMTYLGMLGMIDPPRRRPRLPSRPAREAGIKAVMITGDHPLTARAVATELGCCSAGAS
jgi:Ca2+-transporting ATPase